MAMSAVVNFLLMFNIVLLVILDLKDSEVVNFHPKISLQHSCVDDLFEHEKD
jgi:hypothetical protein